MSYTLYKTYPAKSISYSSKARTASQIKYIVFHYTAVKNDKAVNEAKAYATSNTRSAGAHYFVDDTTVYQSIDDLKIAWAVGGSRYNDYASTGGAKMYGIVTNTNSISIEMCSVNGAISDATKENAVALAKTLMAKYNIPASNCYRHFDVTGKYCPSDRYDGKFVASNKWIGSDPVLWTALKSKLASTSTTSTSTSKATSTTTKKGYTGTFPTLPIRGYFKKGDTGTQVKYVQQFLNWYGSYGLAVDGSYGNLTVSAVKKYQTSVGLKADGCFGNGCLTHAKVVTK